MEHISGVVFSSEVVQLDDKFFTDCTFQSCELIYSGGSVIFERTAILQCSHTFCGSARKTVLYLERFGIIDPGSAGTNPTESVH